MDARPVSRRSFLGFNGTIAPESTPSRSSSSRSKRHSWAFRGYTAPRPPPDVAPKPNREQDSLLSPPLVKRSRSAPSSPGHPKSAASSRDRSPEPSPARPRTAHGFKLRVPNFSRNTPGLGSTLPTIMEQKGAHAADSLRSRITGSKVKQWDGRTRTNVPWDGLRRDSELWFERGNCLVHLYAKSQSRRGPSFRVPLEEIQAAGFESLFSMCYNEVSVNGCKATSNFDGTDSLPKSAVCDIFIPAPDYSSKDDSFSWHITTRNFFAFLFGKALVGASLSKSMIDLQERLDLLRYLDSNNQMDMRAYLERMGYLEFAHCPDYSLALLAYSEFYEQEDLWVDAFVHCVGMNHMLSLSSEFEKTSRVTKALITRAFLEMDLHLGRVTKALSNFLEEDFSQVHLGLSNGARSQLERFRSFLHTYYVEKFGYWPPPKGTVFSKALCKSMYFDFRGLYDYLVDLDSNDSLLDQRFATGGICVLQNLQAFDARHKYIPLPHPHPLLPEETKGTPRSPASRSLLSLRLGSRSSRTDRYIMARDSLFAATNSDDTAVANMPLVKAYRRFERQCTLRPEEKVSLSDGRKVRWMLIYGTIQMLVSVIRAPKEVRDVDSPTYPLCCLVAGTFPWKGGAKALNDRYTESYNMNIPRSPASVDGSLSAKPLPQTPEPSIRPDCEVDDYFGHSGLSPNPDPQRLSAPPAIEAVPGRRRSGLFRSSSFKSSSKTMSVGTVNHGRRTTETAKISNAKFSEILVQGYGNGLNAAVAGESSVTPFELSSEILPEIVVSAQTPQSSPLQKKSIKGFMKRKTCPERLVTPYSLTAPEPSRTPILDSFDVDKIHDPPSLDELDSPSEHSNPLTPVWSRSSSPTSDKTLEGSGIDRHASIAGNSTFSTNSTLLASPIERTQSGSASIRKSFSAEGYLQKEIQIHEMPAGVPIQSTENHVQVYLPSGAPLKKKEASVNLRKEKKSGALKRSDAVSSKRRSLQIKEGIDLFGVLNLSHTTVV